MGLSDWYDGGRLQSFLSTLSYHSSIEHWASHWIKRIIWRGPSANPNVALTFDDGPHPEFTPRILDILAAHQAVATFFLIGRHIERQPAITERLVREGHEIANHTYSHRFLIPLPAKSVIEEVTRADGLIRSFDVDAPRWVRPPMGLASSFTLDAIQSCGFRAVVGDVYPRDPHRPGRDVIVRRVTERVRNGSIIILHDSGTTHDVDRTQTVEALPSILRLLTATGRRSMTVSQLLRTG